MTSPCHQLTGRGALGRRPGESRPPQIVEVDLRSPDRLPGGAPGGMEGMPAEPSTLMAREKRCARICAHVSLQVPLKDGENVRRHRHDSLPGSRLRRSQVQPSIDVVGRSLDPDRSMQHVDIPALEAQHLSDAQVTPSRQLYGDAPLRWHRCHEGVDLGDGHHGPFGRPLLRRSLHHAWVAPNELVGDSGCQNPLEESICLRRRYG